MKRLRAILRQRQGMTLMEIMCAAVLLIVLIEMCAAALSPAARTMQRMRSVSDAGVILDSVLETVRAEAEEARKYVKIYTKDKDLAGEAGQDVSGAKADDSRPLYLSSAGRAVEFVADNGYTTVISAGCQDGPTGRLKFRYFFPDPETGAYDWSSPRESITPFPEEFYAKLYLSLRFNILDTDGDDGRIRHLVITGALYRDCSESGELGNAIYTQSVVADLRHARVLENGVKVDKGMELKTGATAR